MKSSSKPSSRPTKAGARRTNPQEPTSGDQYRGEILRQIHLVDQILQTKTEPVHEENLAQWRATLLGRFSSSMAVLANPGNVDDSASDQNRVIQFWAITQSVVNLLDSGSSAATKKNIQAFLTNVAWKESTIKFRYQNGSGPARSLMQFEAPRAKDACEYCDTSHGLADLAAAGNTTEALLRTSYQALPGAGHPNFPSNSLVEQCLVQSDYFAVLAARWFFKRVSAPIPSGVTNHANYWFTYWKVSAPDEAAQKAAFVSGANYIAPFFP